MVLTDQDGQSDSDTLSVNIVDDVPDAQNDTDAIAAGGFGPATGNLITDTAAGDAGDSDAGADTRGADGALVSSVTATTAAGAPTAVAGATVVQGAYGVLTLNPDGSYSYVRDAGTPGGVSEVFTYTLRDGDGDTDTATLTIAIGNTSPEISNLIPSVNGGDVVVDEDDLADGSDPLPKDSLTQSGGFSISSPDGVASLTIGGVTFINNGVFTAGSFVTGLGNTLSITGYNPLTGVVSYSYTLGDNETHANGAGENSRFEDFAVVLTDQDGQSDSDTLSVKIVDDVPVQPVELNTRVEEFSNPGTNLMIILDTSGSMDFDAEAPGFATRMAVARASILQLINDYDDLGNVMVRLVGFASTATTNFLGSGDIWLTAAQALDVIDDITDTLGNGGTDYDDALIKAMAAYDSAGKIIGGQSVLYFLSDGEPTESTSWPGVIGTGNNGINAAEQTAWQNFLTNNDVQAYALGMGGGATAPALEPISYNGATGTDQPAIIVTDLSQLASTLSGTVQVPTTGNLLIDAGVAFGADGPAALPITSISHDADGNPATPDVIYTTAYSGYNATTHVLTIPTHGGGTLSVNLLTGAYSYSLSLDVANDYTETFRYTISDADGDVKTGVLNMITTDSSEVTVYDNSNEALVYQIMVPGAVTTTTLADFGDVTNSNNSGAGYNPWIYDTDSTGTSVIDLGSNSIATAVISNGDKWIVSTQGGNGLGNLDATVSTSADELRLVDNNGASAGGVEMLTPEFVTSATGSTTLSFDYDRSSVDASDVVTWSLYMFDGSNWVQQSGVGYSGSLSADPGSTTTRTTGDLEAGTRYRIHFSVLDGGGSNDSRLDLDNIKLNLTAAATAAIAIIAAQGNVLTDPNHNPYSSDPWGAVDVLGSENAVLKIWNGSSYTSITTSQTVAGLYGSLEIHSDGAYTYTPISNLSNVGQSDIFTYQVMQSDGDEDTAQLTIHIGATAATVPTPIEGTSGDNALNGTAGDDVLLGHDGNDTIYGNDGNDHIEGGAGNDSLYGDSDNDVLLGGLGTDILDGGIGDDTLIGGLGADTMTGGSGKDTFKWLAGEADGSLDKIADFTLGTGSNGDVLDLSQLLDNVPASPNNSALASALNNYLTFDTVNNTLTIDTNGSTAGGGQLTVMFQNGPNLNHGGLLATNQAIIEQLLNDGNLKVDPHP
ncbi:type I secretion C-terminal target domain-containing protein [Aeromonas rivipollensis]|uniref:type I secretion C-terminal target domain-containing protein n=1 Tax=Aeromonas rivipollensis TaxID=948519 RepID=UPI003D04B10A